MVWIKNKDWEEYEEESSCAIAKIGRSQRLSHNTVAVGREYSSGDCTALSSRTGPILGRCKCSGRHDMRSPATSLGEIVARTCNCRRSYILCDAIARSLVAWPQHA